MKLNKYIAEEKISVVDAMGAIDSNCKGILYIVNSENKLVGSLTDGDIRRWILNQGKLSASVISAMNANPKKIQINDEKIASKIMVQEGITSVPLVDENNQIIKIFFSSDSKVFEKEDVLFDVPVVIMAGGKGTRLYPYTKILPKPLIPIGDIPIIERVITKFNDFGVEHFFVTVNYKKTMIQSYFNEISKNYELEYIEEEIPLGTGGSLKLIKKNFKKSIIVTNCDSLILADYADIYHHHIDSTNDVTIVSALKNFQIPYGVLHTGENGILRNIEEKPKFSYFINTGMYIVKPNLINLIPNDTMFHMTQLVEMVIQRGGKVGIYPISEDSFLDMGEFQEMKRMEEKLNIVTK